jgi:addiction module RelE/StbE family toxin
MAEINWTDQALQDIDNIAEFISKDSLKYAKIQTQLFFERVESLCTQPELGRVVPELQKKKIRELIVGNYRIVYRIISLKRIDILTIHHSRRLLRNNPNIKKYKSR